MAHRKKLLDVEVKLKVAVSDRQSAVADKASLEKQLKQQQSQKLLVEKTLEKKDHIESKKRESIMVVGAAHRPCMLCRLSPLRPH